MVISRFRLILLAGIVPAILAGQERVARILTSPLPSPQEMAALESRVLENPEDLDARIELLRVYADTAPVPGHDDPGRRSVRLQHILYLVEHHPEAAVSASKAAYVFRANGAYANTADHEAVHNGWLGAVQEHPKDKRVIINAVKFLEVEDPDDAELVLRRAMEDDPENREIAANLGFFYAMEIKGVDLLLRGRGPSSIGRDRPLHATRELDQSSNAVVLAAAATALSNLAKDVDAVNGTMLDLAGELSARARQLAPDDPDIQGPMPLIKYFAAAQEGPVTQPHTLPATLERPQTPSRIRVSENVQAVNLIRKTQPPYPDEARNAGITGEVRMTVVIGRDGTIQNVQLISGHPLLVEAAMQTVETWLYKPTLLNGAPVEVVTTITITFPPN